MKQMQKRHRKILQENLSCDISIIFISFSFDSIAWHSRRRYLFQMAIKQRLNATVSMFALYFIQFYISWYYFVSYQQTDR